MNTILRAAALGASVLMCGLCCAATVQLTPVITAYWSSVQQIGQPSQEIPPENARQPGVYRIDIKFGGTLTDAEKARGLTGFGGVNFDINGIGSVLTDAFGGWQPITPSVRTAGDGARYFDPIDGLLRTSGSSSNAFRADLFLENADENLPDLKFIFVEMAARQLSAADPRLTFGQPNQNNFLTLVAGNPLTIGSVVVNWEGSKSGVMSVSFGPTEGYTLIGNQNGRSEQYSDATIGSVSFTPAPEPAGSGVAVLMAIALLGRARTDDRIRRLIPSPQA